MRPVLFAALLTSLVASFPSASAATLESLEARVDASAIAVTARLDGIFEREETLQALQNGSPIVVVYQFELIRKRENWFDSILTSTEIELVATYNSLTREYLLNYRKNRKLVSSQSIRSIEELQSKMEEIREEEMFPIGPHRPEQLRVRGRAILARRYVLHVIPRLVATDWEVSRVQSKVRP